MAFDALAEDYDRGRPGWPWGLLDGISGEPVLDLAAGTGKLTGMLVDRFDCVVAVEPLPGMRRVLERNVPKAKVLAGTAERIPLGEGSVGAVFVAEAFHWFDAQAAAREVHRVLGRDGWLVICFNEWRSGFQPGLPAEASEMLAEVAACLPMPGGPKVESAEWRRGLGAFEPLEELAFDHVWTTDAVGVAAYHVSVSSMGSLPEERRASLRRQLVEMIPHGRHTLPLTARVYRSRQRGVPNGRAFGDGNDGGRVPQGQILEILGRAGRRHRG